MAEESLRYGDADLAEFKKIILKNWIVYSIMQDTIMGAII